MLASNIGLTALLVTLFPELFTETFNWVTGQTPSHVSAASPNGLANHGHHQMKISRKMLEPYMVNRGVHHGADIHTGQSKK